MKRSLIAVLIVLFAFFGWGLLSKIPGRIDQDLAVLPIKPSTSERMLSESDAAAPQVSGAEVVTDTEVPLAQKGVSNEEWESINNAWATSRGYDTVEFHWYKVDDSFVESQAIGGDLGAQKYLAWKTMAADTTASMHWLREAALGGSTAALMGMAERSKLIAEQRLENPWPDRADESDFRVLSLAYPLAAQLRGDNLTAPQTAVRNVTALNLSVEEIAEACIRAKELYDELVAERMNRSMGAFDNSTPPIITDPPNYEEHCTPSD